MRWRHWEQRFEPRRVSLHNTVRIVLVELIQDVHLTRIVGIIQVAPKKLRPRETFPANVAVKALLGRKVFECRVVDARMQVVDVTREMILFREGLVAQLAHWTLLPIDYDI